MNPAPPTSGEEWFRLLRTQAEAAWGSARAEDLGNALRRMAGAISRVAACSPAKGTPPYPPMPSSGAGGGRNE
jgi:hypothetical protein